MGWYSTLDAIALIGLVITLIVGIGSGAAFAEPAFLFVWLSPSLAWLAWSSYKNRGEPTGFRKVGQMVAFSVLVFVFFGFILGIFG